MKSLAWLLIGVALLQATVPSVLPAQKPVTVTGVHGLTFGAVFPGVPRGISRSDPANAGQFDVGHAKFSNIQLTFTLPSGMVGPARATMPLFFGANDAGDSPPETITG